MCHVSSMRAPIWYRFSGWKSGPSCTHNHIVTTNLRLHETYTATPGRFGDECLIHQLVCLHTVLGWYGAKNAHPTAVGTSSPSCVPCFASSYQAADDQLPFGLPRGAPTVLVWTVQRLAQCSEVRPNKRGPTPRPSAVRRASRERQTASPCSQVWRRLVPPCAGHQL